jgi:hypothetical protein
MTDYITKDGLNDAMASMECYPVDVSGKETTEVYQLSKKDANTLATEKLVSMIMYFFIFIFLIVISIFTVPVFYKNTFVEFVKTSYNNGGSDKEKAGSLRTLDWFTNLILISITIGIIVDGNDKKKNIQAITGLFFLIFLAIVNVIIFLLKIFNAPNYNFSQTSFVPPNFEFLSVIIGEIYKLIKNNWRQIIGMFVVLSGILFFTSYLAYLTLNNNLFHPKKNYTIILIMGAFLSLTAIKIFSKPSSAPLATSSA